MMKKIKRFLHHARPNEIFKNYMHNKIEIKLFIKQFRKKYLETLKINLILYGNIHISKEQNF